MKSKKSIVLSVMLMCAGAFGFGVICKVFAEAGAVAWEDHQRAHYFKMLEREVWVEEEETFPDVTETVQLNF